MRIPNIQSVQSDPAEKGSVSPLPRNCPGRKPRNVSCLRITMVSGRPPATTCGNSSRGIADPDTKSTLPGAEYRLLWGRVADPFLAGSPAAGTGPRPPESGALTHPGPGGLPGRGLPGLIPARLPTVPSP